MIVIDSQEFDVDVISLKRKAEVLDKYAKRNPSGVLLHGVIGVYFNYELQFGPGIDPDEYQRLWDKLTEPTEFHTVTVPDIRGAYTFRAYFSNIGDELVRIDGNTSLFKGLTVNFIAQSPARR